MKYKKYYLVILLVVLVDQITKLLVYQHMDMGYRGEIKILGMDWARLHYTLNEGMAFGLTIIPKLALSLFRLLAISILMYFFALQIKNKVHTGFILCLALILGGAIGNAIDSVFYGVFLEGNVIDNAPYPWLHGQVIDMLYFPMFEGRFPEWFPGWGGNRFLFFSAIFNVADSAIFMGAISLLLFNKRFFAAEEPQIEEKEEEEIIEQKEVLEEQKEFSDSSHIATETTEESSHD